MLSNDLLTFINPINAYLINMSIILYHDFHNIIFYEHWS